MKSNCFKIKAFLGFTLFLYFPIGFLIDFTEYVNITIVLLLAFCTGACGSFLILPFMRSIFNLSTNETSIKTSQIK